LYVNTDINDFDLRWFRWDGTWFTVFQFCFSRYT